MGISFKDPKKIKEKPHTILLWIKGMNNWITQLFKLRTLECAIHVLPDVSSPACAPATPTHENKEELSTFKCSYARYMSSIVAASYNEVNSLMHEISWITLETITNEKQKKESAKEQDSLYSKKLHTEIHTKEWSSSHQFF